MVLENLVSVVVTCYNHEQYVRQCLESIFEQSYQNIELLVYNDGSTDKSGDVILETLENSPFLRTEYIFHENMGLVNTRNKAFDTIRGEYLIFVDSDDILEKNYVETLLNMAIQKDADIVYSRLVNLQTQELILEAREFDLQRLFIENYINASSLVKVSSVGTVRFDEQLNRKKLEDYEFFLRLVLQNKVKCVPCSLTHLNYRILNHSRSERDNLRNYFETYAYILGKHFNVNPELAKVAMTENIKRLYDLTQVGNFNVYSEYVKVYLYDGELGATEDNSVQYSMKREAELKLYVPDHCDNLRIDLSEMASVYKNISLLNEEKNGIILQHHNGVLSNGLLVFPDKDPQMVYDVSDEQGRYVTFSYQVVERQEWLKELGNIISLMNHRESLLENSIEQMKNETIKVTNEIKQKDIEYTQLKSEYDLVVNSRRWKIMTKIIDFFRGK